ncbi:hypothetical protein A9Q84_11745 [Halobacteriovorax marinus]|uniref:Geranyltranstransferase n=1 Tax=Halobacteriovorax marinus TaxID=97084 RepID=A0A1Y5FC31_9BACT|nr:hypothetical protein A9Q84_11745 [Halobacteriovorax marinus]
MNIETIVNNIEIHLNSVLPKQQFKEVYLYGVLPPGKAFRPQLVSSIFADYNNSHDLDFLNNPKNEVNYLSSAVELHHAYTLLHDDLPCMDDDDIRRGKPATHKAFSEWKALLAGDGLQTASFALLSKYSGKNLSIMLKFFSWALGPKGLIQGQFLDLSEEMTKSFESLILTHQLKTARLIQTSLLLGYWSSSHAENRENIYETSKTLFKLGHAIGIVFQLLDDLTELVDDELSSHESAVNPWLGKFGKNCFESLVTNLSIIDTTLNKEELTTTKSVLKNYFKKIETMVVSGKTNIERHSNNNLMPIVSLLERINT